MTTMALEGAHADEGYANIGGPKDGPVLTMMSKRLRALKKKYNRILQIEENKTQGKTVNKEQEDVLKTKIAIAALIDEYEKLRQPLLIAVKEEVAEREKELMEATLEREEEEDSVCEGGDAEAAGAPQPEAEIRPYTANGEAEDSEKHVEGYENGLENGFSPEVHEREVSAPECQEGSGSEQDKSAEVEKESILREYETESSVKESVFSEGDVADLLKLLYFAHLFDVRSQGDAPSLVWTKVHERSSCLSYDFVTDDATTPLIEGDLDSLSLFGSMLTSRPPNETLSHRDALQRCIEHARDWLLNSDRLIHSDASISYSRLRERLNRILSSEYFTMTPELQTVNQQTAAAAASAAGQYLTTKEVDHVAIPTYYPAQEPQPVAQVYEYGGLGSNGEPPSSSPLINFLSDTPEPAFEIPQFGSHEESHIGAPDDTEEAQAVEQPTEAAVAGDGQQPQPPIIPHHHHYPHAHHQQGPPQGGGRSGVVYQQGHPGGGGSLRGRGVPGGYQGMGGRSGRGIPGGYPNGGRGGRGSRGGMYPNGGRGGQFYDQPGGFHPRPNHYGGRGGRGGRGGMIYNGHANGAAPPPPPAVATGSA